MMVVADENATRNQHMVSNADLLDRRNMDMVIDLTIVAKDKAAWATQGIKAIKVSGNKSPAESYV